MTSSSQPVVLQLPADPALLRVARVTVASVAADLAFTVRDIEDLRIAVDELAAVVIAELDPTVSLTVEVRASDDGVDVVGRVPAPAEAALHPVAADLLAMVAPGYALSFEDGERRFRFSKRVQVHAP